MFRDFCHSVRRCGAVLDLYRTRLIRFGTALLVASLAIAWSVTEAPLGAQHSLVCQPRGELVWLPDVPEASGLAASRRVPGRLWTHNDSGQPLLFALNEQGQVIGRLRISGATVNDWEAIVSAQCGNDVCLYIGDIGDNSAKRDHITIYRVPEPASTEQRSARAEEIRATYPDGAHDAETLLVVNGRLHIVTKGNDGPVALYRFPPNVQAGSAVQLERVGILNARRTHRNSTITDGTISADGHWVVLRSHNALMFFRASDFLAGHWQTAFRVDLTPLGEPQGEGVALANNTVFLAGEGGAKNRAGTFARFACAPPE